MPSAPPWTLTYDFATDASAQNYINAAALQTQLQALQASLVALEAALEVSIRDDNTLTDSLVQYRNLSTDTIQQLQASFGTIVPTLVTPGDATVSTMKLVDAAVTTVKIADGAITAAKLAAGAIGPGSLAANSVATANLIDAAVTAAKLAANAVATANLIDGSITAAKLAAHAVATANIQDNAVGAAQIADGSITKAKFNGIGAETPVGNFLRDDFTWAASSAGSSACYAKILDNTPVSVIAAASAVPNRLHAVSGTAGDYAIILPAGGGVSIGGVVGFYVADWSAANKQYTLDAGGTVKIAGRVRYLTLIHTNVVLLQWDGAAWQPLVLNLDTPDVQEALVMHADVDPALGAGTTATRRWCRRGNRVCYVGNIQQILNGGSTGTGAYFVNLPLGTIDYSLVNFNDDIGLWHQMGCLLGNGNGFGGGVTIRVMAYPASANRVRFVAGDGAGTWNLWSATWFSLAAANYYWSFQFEIPVTNW